MRSGRASWKFKFAMVPLVVASAVSIAGVTSSFGGGSSMPRGGSSSSSYGHSGGGRGGFGIGGAVGLGLSIGGAIPEPQRQAPPPEPPKRSVKQGPPPPPEPPARKKKDDECPQYPNGTIDQVAKPANTEQVQEKCGMIAKHAENLAKYTAKQHWIVIVRANNKNMKDWFGDKDVHPKPVETKDLKIGKIGESGKAKGTDGNWYHSDYDLMGVYDVRDPHAIQQVILENSAGTAPDRLGEMNDAVIGPNGKRMFQHSQNDSYKTLDIARMKFEPVRYPGEKEWFTVAEEDGTLRVICGAINLERYYYLRGIPWPYGNPPPSSTDTPPPPDPPSPVASNDTPPPVMGSGFQHERRAPLQDSGPLEILQAQDRQ